MIDLNVIPSPCYVIVEKRLRENLTLIKKVKEDAGIEIIVALKAFAMWKTFNIFREYIPYATASSIYEAQLVFEEMGTLAHTYAPVYTDEDFPKILKFSSHITFNSISQYEHFRKVLSANGNPVSCGLRINPEFSVVDTDIYNPSSPGSRLGIISSKLKELPEGIEGLHFHTLCESTSYDLEKVLNIVEKKFGHLFAGIKWINMGGGHLMTKKEYNVNHLIWLLKEFKSRYPHLQIILEPGSAFTWETGFLKTNVIDIIENNGIETAIMNASFSCHMPDCLEMPYKPIIRNAYEPIPGKPTYRIGGCSCLSGDYIGNWSFDYPLKKGDNLIFEDMIHYTVVKTTMFNGVSHPSIALWTKAAELIILRKFEYIDYKNRMC